MSALVAVAGAALVPPPREPESPLGPRHVLPANDSSVHAKAEVCAN
jgi:hypothetical protein